MSRTVPSAKIPKSKSEPDMTPIERFIVVLASFASPQERRNLRLFFEEWERMSRNG